MLVNGSRSDHITNDDDDDVEPMLVYWKRYW